MKPQTDAAETREGRRPMVEMLDGQRPPDMTEADWRGIVKGSAFSRAVGLAHGDSEGRDADAWLDFAGEIEDALRAEGYVVVPEREAEARVQADAELLALLDSEMKRLLGLADRYAGPGPGSVGSLVDLQNVYGTFEVLRRALANTAEAAEAAKRRIVDERLASEEAERRLAAALDAVLPPLAAVHER